MRSWDSAGASDGTSWDDFPELRDEFIRLGWRFFPADGPEDVSSQEASQGQVRQEGILGAPG